MEGRLDAVLANLARFGRRGGGSRRGPVPRDRPGLVWQIWRASGSQDLHDRQACAARSLLHASRASDTCSTRSASVRSRWDIVLLRIYNIADKVRGEGLRDRRGGHQYLRNTPVSLAEFRKLALPGSWSHPISVAPSRPWPRLSNRGAAPEGEGTSDLLIIPLTPEAEIRATESTIDRLIPG
jgi:hypothetical protein